MHSSHQSASGAFCFYIRALMVDIQTHTRKSLGGSKTDVVGVGVVTAAMKCTNGLSLQVQSDSFVLLYMRFRLLDILVFNI